MIVASEQVKTVLVNHCNAVCERLAGKRSIGSIETQFDVEGCGFKVTTAPDGVVTIISKIKLAGRT
jgi:hypothetical protein